MDSLPTELILLICRCINKIDLKSLRLVSRRFRDIPLSTLFTSVKVSPSIKHFEVLRSVADHPIISRCIRQVVYIEFKFFHHVRLITEDGVLDLPDPRFQTRPEEAIAYKSLILQSDVHVNTIANALSKMPNVREVICKNSWYLDLNLYESDIYFIPEFNRATICDPRISRLYPKAGGNESLVAVHVNNLYRDGVEKFLYFFGFNYGLSILCRAISISNMHLQTLSIGCPDGTRKSYFNPLYYIYPATFVLMSPRELEHTCNAFQYLQKISLSFNFCPNKRDSSSIRGNGIEENVARILAAAKSLRDLRLDFNEIGLMDGCFTLKEYLGSCTWPQLQSLHIGEKHVKEEELTDLIYRHRPTLKYLSLDTVHLVDAGWWTWARQVQPWVSSSSFEKIDCFNSQETGVNWMCDNCLGNYLLQGDDGLCLSCRLYKTLCIPSCDTN
jgi:F-box-like